MTSTPSGGREAFVQPTNMAPVMDVLDKWGMETPFAEDDVVGTSVLAVSDW